MFHAITMTSATQHILLPDKQIRLPAMIIVGSWTQVKKENFKNIPQCFTEAKQTNEQKTNKQQKITIIKKLIFA